MTAIVLPDPSLVVLVGAAGSGKSTFAARHFRADEILSSDAFRALIAGDERDQTVSRTAFAILHREVTSRLTAGRLVVVDATSVKARNRRPLVARARAAGVPAVAIVIALLPEVVHARNRGRIERVVAADVVAEHLAHLAAAEAEGAGTLFAGEGFAAVHVLRTPAEVDAVRIERRPAGGPADRAGRSSRAPG